eukprot:gene9857-12093_t
MTTKIAQASLDQLFFNARTANGFIDKPVPLELLKEAYDIAKMGATSAAKYHLFIEAMRRAFRDRAEFLGDPDFVNVPTAGLLDRAYIAGLMQNFDPAKATPSDGLAPGKPAGWKPITHPSAPVLRGLNAAESTETTHYSIVDAAGNAVSNTYTLNGGYGSGVTIP